MPVVQPGIDDQIRRRADHQRAAGERKKSGGKPKAFRTQRHKLHPWGTIPIVPFAWHDWNRTPQGVKVHGFSVTVRWNAPILPLWEIAKMRYIPVALARY